MNTHTIQHAHVVTWRFLATCVCALAFLLAGCGGAVELVSGLSEEEANEVLGALLNSGITASKGSTKTGVTISVQQSRIGAAIELLHQQGLPRERHTSMGDIFKKENLISSPLEERARYLYALSQELEKTLSRIDGVLLARVHVVLPERIGPGEPTVPSSASVFLKHQSGFGVDNVVKQVRALTANSIPGLSQEKVTVVLVPAAENAQSRQATHLENVLFVRVEQGSAISLRILLASMGLAIFLGVGAGMMLSRGGWMARLRNLFPGRGEESQ